MPLLEPDPDALRPAARPETPAPDRVPEHRAGGTPEPLRGELAALLGADKVLTKVSDLVRYASDASPYRFVPQVVVVPEDIDDVSAILSYAHGKGRDVVFRAAGTSLNGQAQGEDILVDVRRHWTGVEVLSGGERARIGPGTTVARANAELARHGRVLGPDPASAIACTLGGVVANNASGMTAGGTLPLVVDASSCTLGLAHEVVPYLTADNRELHQALTIVDSLVWAAEELLPRLTVHRTADSAVLHPTCSMRHLGDEAQLRTLAEACADEVVVPDDAGCCAFAGDRGMLHKELTESATRKEAAFVASRTFDAYLSANRMCEVGMDQATGRGYRSVLLELERATRPDHHPSN